MKKNKIKNAVLSVLTLTAIVAVFVIIEKTSNTSGHNDTRLSIPEVEEFGERNPKPVKIQTTSMETNETGNEFQSPSSNPISEVEEAEVEIEVKVEETEEAKDNNPTYSESDYKRAEKYISKNWSPDNTIDKEAYIAAGGTYMNYWNKPNNQLPTNLVDENKENNSDQGLLD